MEPSGDMMKVVPRDDDVGAGGDENEAVPDCCNVLLLLVGLGLREKRDSTSFHEMRGLSPEEFLLSVGAKESEFWIRREPKVSGELALEPELATLSGEAPLPQPFRSCGGT